MPVELSSKEHTGHSSATKGKRSVQPQERTGSGRPSAEVVSHPKTHEKWLRSVTQTPTNGWYKHQIPFWDASSCFESALLLLVASRQVCHWRMDSNQSLSVLHPPKALSGQRLASRAPVLQKRAPEAPGARAARLDVKPGNLVKVPKDSSPPTCRAAGEGCSSKNKTLWSNTESPARKKGRKGSGNGDGVHVKVTVTQVQTAVFLQGYSRWQWRPPWPLVWGPGSHLGCIYSPCEEGLWWVARWSKKQTLSRVRSELGGKVSVFSPSRCYTSLAAKVFFLTRSSAALKLSSTRTGSSEETKSRRADGERTRHGVNKSTFLKGEVQISAGESYFPGSHAGSVAERPHSSPDPRTYRREWAHRRCTGIQKHSESSFKGSVTFTDQVRVTCPAPSPPECSTSSVVIYSGQREGCRWLLQHSRICRRVTKDAYDNQYLHM